MEQLFSFRSCNLRDPLYCLQSTECNKYNALFLPSNCFIQLYNQNKEEIVSCSVFPSVIYNIKHETRSSNKQIKTMLDQANDKPRKYTSFTIIKHPSSKIEHYIITDATS